MAATPSAEILHLADELNKATAKGAHANGASAKAKTPEEWINWVNQRHAFVMIGGSGRVMNIGSDPMNGLRTISYSRPSDFRQKYRNISVPIGKDEIDLGALWLDHPNRREYEGVLFDPSDEHPGYFNLWTDFAVEPKEGDCTLYFDHLRNIICDGSEERFQYVIAWMADAVQNPSTRPGTALVFRGGQGTGKSLACQYFANIFGLHSLTVAHRRHLIGNFNAHLHDCLVVVAEEAFWGGDRKAEGVLKDLVTGDFINIERKGVDVQRARNVIRLLMTSNQEWVVPAGVDERRFAVLDVSDKQQQNHAYFAAMDDQMKSGGQEALLHYLLNYDYAHVNLRKIPVTDALTQQKFASMDAMTMFWYEALQEGNLGYSGWPGEIVADELRKKYQEKARDAGHSHKGWDTQLGVKLKRLCPSIKKTRKTVTYGNFSSTKSIYSLPPLEDCRSAFDKATGCKWEWQPLTDEGGGGIDGNAEVPNLNDKL